ncbi:MAG: T9SS type A sorting domain-containing protein [Candidatus Eisenbacteria bacterium]|nr:T9SS type A sorting domain-containing protein [Candidatus Eisenbacteria bacterium]
MSTAKQGAIVRALVAALCLLLAAVSAAAAPSYIAERKLGVDDPRAMLWEPKQAAFERLQAALALPPDAARATQEDYDALYYDIDIQIDELTETVDGLVSMTAASLVDGLTTVILDLYDNLTVDSVEHDGAPASYTHNNDLITVSLNTSANTGDTFEITVTYHGAPIDDALNFSTHLGTPIISSLSEPSGARQWWPCKDNPADKADSARVTVTVDDAFVAVSNGMLDWSTDNGATKTYSWIERYPITTYLISVAVTNYSSWTDYYTHPGGSMPIENFVYPEHYANAVEDLNITAGAIEALASVYGEYPFIDERYGHAIFPWGGAMEHQTCTSYGRVLIRGDHYYDWILVHELSHQWWGDCVTCGTWNDIWLNEGFASYSEALYYDVTEGEPSYDDYIESFDAYGYFDGPIYDPWATFNRTVYDKGALVLHMLRRVLALKDSGTMYHYPIDALQAVLANYRNAHAYGTAVTDDFQSLCEEYYGQSMDWFFLPWVYGENRPDYEWSWIAGDQGPPYGVMIHVEQVQSDAGLFTMPIDFELQTTGGDVLVTGWNDQLNQDFFFQTTAPVTDVTFDPDNWILKYMTEVGTGSDVVAVLSLSAPSGAVGGSADIAFSVPTDGHVNLAVYDVSGRLVDMLVDRNVTAGRHEIVWDGTTSGGSAAASGVYFARLVTEAGNASRKIVLVR